MTMDQSRSRFIKFARTPFHITTVEKFLQKLTRGKSSDSFIGKLPPKHIDYLSPTVRRTQVSGINFELDLGDLLGWYLYWGFSDPSRQKLYSLFREADVVIDIGANLGEVALRAAQKVGPEGQVFAFEPFPANYSKLSVNINLNSFPNLSIFMVGLGDTATQVRMVTPENQNAGMNRVASDKDDEGTSVEIIKLDDFVRERNISRIDVIKIDVEGYEMRVLTGASETLSNLRPKIFTEVIDAYLREQGASAKQLIEFLAEHNYRLSHAATGNDITPSRIPSDYQFDLVAIPY